MDKQEYEIMRDAFSLLKEFADVPAISGCEKYFKELAEHALAFAQKWENHELAIQMGVSIQLYLEAKYKAQFKE